MSDIKSEGLNTVQIKLEKEAFNSDELVNRSSPLNMNMMPISFDNHSVSFVMSNVGHPMLAVNHYTFHKHSINQKTGRISWRCSRRRVKDINCSSSCYTVDGIVSNPTPHTLKCSPISQSSLKMYQNKRFNMQKSSFINTKAESYTTLKSKKNEEFIDSFNEPHTFEDFEDPNNIAIFEQSFCKPRMLFNKNEAKQRLAELSKDMSSNFVSTIENHAEQLPILNNSNPNYNSEYNQTPESSKSENFSQSPRSFANILGQIKDLKSKEIAYSDKLNRANKELNKVKKSNVLQIQALKWKSTIMEIDMNSMKQMINQRSIENSGLKKLCDEMLLKLKSKNFY